MSKYGIFGAENKEAPQLVNARILFGLSTDATLDDFKKAYRQISMKWHPDKHHGLSTFEEAGQRYSLYTAAYELHSRENKKAGAQKEFSKSLEEPFIVGDRVFCLGTLYGTRVYIPDENKGGLITSASRLLGGGSSVNYDESYSAITKKKYYGIRQSILESPLADLLEVFYGTNPIGPVNTQLLHDAFVNRSHGGLDDLLWIRENEQGIYHFMNRDFDSAVSMFSKINSQVSDNIINMYRLGVSLEAKASVTGFKKNNPSEWTSTMNSAINQYVNALQLIQKRRYSWIGPAGQERPSKFEPKSQLTVLMQLADAYNCVGEYDLARKLWQKAKDINPSCYEAQIKASMLAIKLPSFKRFFGLLSSKNTD